MAARRLLIVMLVLLGVSTLAAALVPPRSPREGSTTSTTTETEPVDTVPRGEGKSARIEVDSDRISVVPVALGDQLSLTIASRRADLVEIPAIGLIDSLGPNGPALFDVFASRVGSYGIRLVEADRLVGRIEVTADKKRPSQAAGRGKASSAGG
jgi:hypothetical protein